MLPRLELYVSQRRTAALLGLTCVMVGASYFCTTIPGIKAKVAGWIGVCFFGLGFIAFPCQLMRSGLQFVIDEHGLEDRRSKFGLIEWADILSLSIGTVHSQRFLCIDVVDPEKYLSRLSKTGRAVAQANKGLGFPEISLGFSGLTKTTDEVFEFIQEHYDPIRKN
jgi:hypothetical protein